MRKTEIYWKNTLDGIVFYLEQKKIIGKRRLPVSDWINVVDSQRMFAIGKLLHMLEEQDTEKVKSGASCKSLN